MRKRVRRRNRAARAAVGAVALVGLGLAGQAAVRWHRYGRTSRRGDPDPQLDRFIPRYEVREFHEGRVDAPADATFQTALAVNIERSALVRLLFRGREMLMGARGGERHGRAFLEQIEALGWRKLAEEPGRKVIFGAAAKPWLANVEFRGLPPATFAEFEEPGYAKIAWMLAVEPRGADAAILRTETRVVTTDPDARARFRRYWALVSPGVRLIRREVVRLVKAEAERTSDAGVGGPPARLTAET